jgi:hypothetical protein
MGKEKIYSQLKGAKIWGKAWGCILLKVRRRRPEKFELIIVELEITVFHVSLTTLSGLCRSLTVIRHIATESWPLTTPIG